MSIVRALDNGIPGYNRKPSYRGVWASIPSARHIQMIKATANLDVSVIRVEID